MSLKSLIDAGDLDGLRTLLRREPHITVHLLPHPKGEPSRDLWPISYAAMYPDRSMAKKMMLSLLPYTPMDCGGMNTPFSQMVEQETSPELLGEFAKYMDLEGEPAIYLYNLQKKKIPYILPYISDKKIEVLCRIYLLWTPLSVSCANPLYQAMVKKINSYRAFSDWRLKQLPQRIQALKLSMPISLPEEFFEITATLMQTQYFMEKK